MKTKKYTISQASIDWHLILGTEKKSKKIF